MRAQLQAVISAESLAIMAGVLVAWFASHAIGIGEIIDIILLTVGVVAIGFSIFKGLDHLYLFATARSMPDLDAAADHFAKAIAILGVQAVLAVLFRGSAINSRLVALYHEQVHRWFMPKLYLMRNFRVECAAGSYVNSSLWRYLMEMLAEGISNGRVYGFREFFVGFGFPVQNGYLYLVRAGANPLYFDGLAGRGLIPEGAGLLVSGSVLTMPVELWHSSSAPRQ